MSRQEQGLSPQDREKLPLDAKLLSEAIIELNISRRSVSLYPGDHPITRESLKRAYDLLKRLFEIRPSITLGITRESLIVDEYILDKKNPVFREFSLSLHEKGIAAVTFQAGMSMDELFGFHEIIISKLGHPKDTLEMAQKKGLRHILISPIDISKFQFIEDHLREDGKTGSVILEDYVSGLLEGRLAEGDAEGVILMTPPDEIAEIINGTLKEDSPEETYERVITAYVRKKANRIRSDLFQKFISLLDKLKPEIKKQFLQKSFTTQRIGSKDIEEILKDLSQEDIDRLMRVFEEQATLIPETLKNLMNKLYETKGETRLLEIIVGDKTVVHDIELDEKTVRLFSEDHFDTYVPEDYVNELNAMLKGIETRKTPLSQEAERTCSEEYTDKTISGIIIELLHSETAQLEEFLQLLTRLSEFVQSFLDTGRFDEILEIYNAVYSYSLTGKFKQEAASMIEYFFKSEQFITRLLESFRLWGGLNKDGVLRLSAALRHYIIKPLMGILLNEKDMTIRRFYLFILSKLGSDVADEAASRIKVARDKKTDKMHTALVLKDIIYLIRECGGRKYVKEIRNLARHEEREVALEAVKTLLHFKTPDAVSFLRLYLKSENPDTRDMAVRLAGTYRVREVVPYLLELLEKKDILGTESYYRKSVVQALGEIGDAKAIEVLKKIYSSKTLLFWSDLEELKLEIFKTLHKYPFEAAKPLLELGLNSKNKDIVAISKRLLEEKR